MKPFLISQLITVALAAGCPVTPPADSQEWDAIVVGAGMAGIIVAEKQAVTFI